LAALDQISVPSWRRFDSDEQRKKKSQTISTFEANRAGFEPAIAFSNIKNYLELETAG
jgi:hypothetical protein